MASIRMNIPKIITIGYQKRNDTYTGKLAYVIYTDNKGKLRKEYSWNNWRTKSIKPDEYSNEPTSGFVLNKGVGGARQSYGWNARNEYIRVYDPRGFEFEISVANLLFILQECTATKGKGIEGEFVYSWDGKDLVLLPVSSQEYIECSKFTDHQSGKVTKNDMVEGCSYLMKDMVEVMYLGRHDYYEPKNDYRGNYSIALKGKKHIFLRLSKKENSYYSTYILQTGFTNLAAKTSDEALSQYAKEYDKFKKSIHSSPAIEVKVSLTKIQLSKDYGHQNFLLKEGNNYLSVQIERDWSTKEGTYNIIKSNSSFSPSLKDGVCYIPKINNYGYNYNKENKTNVTTKELLQKQFYTAALITEKGGSYDMLKD